MEMQALARAAMEDMPPQGRFRAEDGEVIRRHADLLLSLESSAVDGFYDTVFAHGPTAAVFRPGERPAREETLANWWRRTATGPHDEEYFSWMAMVGLVHVVRGVSNPMMLAMSDYVARFVATSVRGSAVPGDDQDRLIEAYRRLAATVSAIITYGYDQAVESALFDVAGMPAALLHRLRDAEVASAVRDARAELGR